MELTNEFEVAVPVDHAWTVLTDVERIAPCLPGAKLDEVEDDHYRGTVKVKVGPITAQYRGTAHFVERDDVAHRAVLTASGRDSRGQGNANATVTAQLTSRGDRTHVSVVTDLQVTGKVAQFGRGVMAEVSAKLLDQFVDNLERTVLPAAVDPAAAGQPEEDSMPEDTTETETAETAAGTDDEARPAASSNGSGARTIDSVEPAPADLGAAAGPAALKRAVPVIIGVILLVLVVRFIRRRRRG